MTLEVTLSGVAADLAQLSRDLVALTDGLEELERRAVNCREDYTLAYSKAFLAAQGAMELRKYTATTETHAERLAAETAEALVRGRRAQIATLKTRIDVGRSIGSLVKSELDMDKIR